MKLIFVRLALADLLDKLSAYLRKDLPHNGSKYAQVSKVVEVVSVVNQLIDTVSRTDVTPNSNALEQPAIAEAVYTAKALIDSVKLWK